MPSPISHNPLRSTRVAVIGNSGQIRFAWKKSGEELFNAVGANTGNLAFWFAVTRHLNCGYQYFDWNFDPAFIKANFDVVLFVAANQLNPSFDYGDLANQFEKCDRPLVVVGLGAQADSLENTVTLRPGTERLLRVFSERSRFIGMRGEFSAEAARQHGVENTRVMGCPSNFINPSALDLGHQIAAKLKSIETPHRLCLNLDLNEHLIPIVRRCIQWMDEWDGTIVMQSPLEPILCAMGKLDLVPQDVLDRYAKIVLGTPCDEAGRHFLATKLTSFFDADAWMTYLRSCSLSLGTRLHGNILAFQAGTPSVIFPHDSRTSELARTIGLPIVDVEAAARAESVKELLTMVDFDGEAYDRRRSELAAVYVDLLEGSGIAVSDELKRLSTYLDEPAMEE